LAAGYRYIEYLKDIKYFILEYGRTINLLLIFNITNDFKDLFNKLVFIVASDVAFVDDERTYKSIKGMALILFGGIFDWLSHLQSTVIISIIEAELFAIAYLMS
jgi:hypothetical protein